MNSRNILETFFQKYTKRVYKGGEMILRAGDMPSGVLFLQHGFVRMSCDTRSGDVFVLHIFREGSVFPLPWVINEIPNRYSFEALGPVVVYRASRQEVYQFLHEHQELQEDLLSRILGGLSGILLRMECLVTGSAYQNTVSFLSYYGRLFGQGSTEKIFTIPITHKEIASWIGTTRETASVQIGKLQKKGLIRYAKRSIVIPSLLALEKEGEALRE
jgi:CRP-like cAMP-binding protein